MMPTDRMPKEMTAKNWQHRCCVRVGLMLLWAPLIIVAPGFAQETAPLHDWEEYADSRPFPTSRIEIPQWRLTDGLHVRSAFRDVIADVRPSTVRVRSDGRDTALGGIVGADGWIVTKASRLTGEITCVLADRREIEAQTVGVNRDYDIALLRIDAQRLNALKLAASPAPKIGAWLATVGMKRGPLAVGVLSVEARKIRHRAGVLGVLFDIDTQRPVIMEVFPGTAAWDAGLKADDELFSLNGERIPFRRPFIGRIREFNPGDQIALRVLRGDEVVDVEALLTGPPPGPMSSREDFQNRLGSLLSQRRGGFPKAFQHDTVVKPSDCGGPVVNLDGEVVGFNIARAGRTETYAIPIDVVVGLIEDLKAASPSP